MYSCMGLPNTSRVRAECPLGGRVPLDDLALMVDTDDTVKS